MLFVQCFQNLTEQDAWHGELNMVPSELQMASLWTLAQLHASMQRLNGFNKFIKN